MVNCHRFFPRVSLNPVEEFRGGAEEPFLTQGLYTGGARHRGVARRIVTPSFVDPKQRRTPRAV